MTESSITKINRLPPAVKERISQADIFSELDSLDEDFGIKTTIILVDLLSGDLDYADLDELLEKDYGFNEFLADQVKKRFGSLIELIGQSVGVKKDSAVADSEMDARLTFSREDEEEVGKYRHTQTANVVDYEIETDRIVNNLKLDLTDEILIKRLRNIVLARLKDVRDDLETLDNLMKSRKVGGMEFTQAEADRILKVIKKGGNTPESASSTKVVKKFPTANPRPEIVRKEKVQATDEDIRIEDEDGLPTVKMSKSNLPLDLSDELPMVIQPKAQSEKKEQLPKTEQNGKIKSAVEIKNPVAEKNIPAVDLAEKLPPPNPLPYVANRRIPETVLNSKTANKPNLDDVKFEKRLMGPIEELENMTLIEFRRIAADPQTAVNKVKEKIDLLGQETFEKKMQGISAWHRSEVNRFYRLLGQASMAEGKSIENIIKERLLSGKPTLSIDELQAIIELNRTLRF
jgi:hypothetical protein